ncbi:SCO2322 family protein [Streptomyces sp. NPDC050619]|uniref:SCO2322 family protein n=1 Tax=Streptomyces sp. NPDC050619 TaxID=3157214 RepID=UPI00342610AE
MIRRRRTAALTVLAALPLLGNVLFGSMGQAQAAGYRYWSFWERDGNQWTYATQGPSTARPSDGDVQGFRFAVSEDSGAATRPRGTAEFTTICAKTPARDGQKRVALVIDFGTATDAPSGEIPPATRTACARVSPDATTAEALAAVAKPLRYGTDALLCAIAGYPEKGCGEQVTAERKPSSKPGRTDKSDEADAGPSLGLLAGAVVVALFGLAAAWQARRRRDAP